MISGCQQQIETELSNMDSDEDYMIKIKEYVYVNNIQVTVPNADPKNMGAVPISLEEFEQFFQVRRVEEGEFQGKKVIVVRLTCCGMGDAYFIDKQSQEVIGHSFGPL